MKAKLHIIDNRRGGDTVYCKAPNPRSLRVTDLHESLELFEQLGGKLCGNCARQWNRQHGDYLRFERNADERRLIGSLRPLKAAA